MPKSMTTINMDCQAKKCLYQLGPLLSELYGFAKKKDCSTKASIIKFGVCMYHVSRHLQKESLTTTWNNDVILWQFVKSKTVA